MRAIVVTPTYNERLNIEPLFIQLKTAAPSIEILVVDDGSPDGTGDVVEALAKDIGGVHLMRRPGKGGLASAYVEGFRRALELGAQRVVQMDADLSHDPADVPRLLDSGADLALGSRYVPGGGTRNWPPHRRALSRFGSAYARLCLGLPYSDLTGGFKAWQASTLNAVLQEPVRSEGYVFQVEMTLRAHRLGVPIEEIPIIFRERVHGASKMSLDIALEAALAVPRLTRP